MKKYSVWQKIQAVLCFLILLIALAPMALMAIVPQFAADIFRGVLLDEAMSTSVGTMSVMQRAILGGSMLIALLCALRMLVLIFSRGKRDRTGVELPNSPEGPIHISVPAVETLVSQGIKDVPGLSDVRMKVYDHRDAISIEITMSARSDINIPETMLELQTRIKSYVQESAGVDVRDVRLNVDRVILADAIPALPAGRGGLFRKEQTVSDQPAQSYTFKEGEDKPIVETHEPVSAQAEAPNADAAHSMDDDDDEPEGGHKGWFGRRNHKKREDKPQTPGISAVKPDGDVGSVSDYLRRYETGETEAQRPGESANSDESMAAQSAPEQPEPIVSDAPEAVVIDAPEAIVSDAPEQAEAVNDGCGDAIADSAPSPDAGDEDKREERPDVIAL